MNNTDKASLQQIAARFSAAANSYQQHDVLQRLSAAKLLSGFPTGGCILDIGAGPGTDFMSASALLAAKNIQPEVVALDIAEGMLAKLKQNFPHYVPVGGDAEQLPFFNASFDCVYSNLALQWCQQFSAAVAETHRVLRADGEFHLSVVAQDSLFELAELGLTVNRFASLETIVASFADGWQLIDTQVMPMTVYFRDLKSLLYSIKGVGAAIHAQAINRDSEATRPHGLRGRQDWQQLVTRAEQFRTKHGLPLTYQIAVVRARKWESRI